MTRGAEHLTTRSGATPAPTRLPYRVILCVAICAVAVIMLPPWIPAMPRAGLDPSWAAVLSHAFNAHWQFGKDLVFTFGPFGFLYSNLFDPGTNAWMLGAWVFIALALGAGTAILLRHAKLWESLVIAALLFVGLRSSAVEPMLFNDPVFFVLPLLLSLMLEQTGRVATVAATLLCVLVALVGLVKFTFWMLGVATIVAIESGRAFRGKRMPRYLFIYAAATMLFFSLAGQSLAGLPRYIMSSFAVAAGYSESMQRFSWFWPEVVICLVLGTAFVAVAAHLTWKQARQTGRIWTDWPPLAVLVLFIFMVLKAGFVRHDFHALIAWGALTAGFALCAAHFVPRLQGQPGRTSLILICGMCGVGAVARYAQVVEQPFSAFFTSPSSRSVSARVGAITSLLAGTQVDRWVRERDAALQGIRTRDPLPPLSGSVDVYPWNAAAVLANGLDYRPRPVFQSFAVFNSTLLEINRQHLDSDRAASTILFELATIDGRLVAEDEGALWPLLASRYDTEAAGGRYVVLHRRASPRRVEWRINSSIHTGWAQDVAVPQTGRPVWVQIDLQKTAWGKLNDVFYKMPVIDMTLTLANGDQPRRRLVPPIAHDRFLLSPLIITSQQWAETLGTLRARGDAVAQPVIRIRIESPVPGNVASVYSNDIKVTFSELLLDARR